MIRVVLVDDHEMVRLGLSAFLSTQEDLDVCGQASNGKEGIELAKAHRPDVVLMDLVMDEMDGIEATAALTRELPDTKVIVLTSYIEDEKVYPVIEAGAFSYLLKTSSAVTIADAIRRAAAGEAFIEAQVTSKMMAKMREKKVRIYMKN